MPHDWRDDNPDVATALADHRAQKAASGKSPKPNGLDQGVTLTDFYAYMPQHKYMYAPSRELWPAGSVNGRLPKIAVAEGEIPATRWLDQNRPVEQMTWAPGQPMIIDNRLVSEGGWVDRQGVSCFNLYREPTLQPGDANAADPWIRHVQRLYPDDADHLIRWFAHRIQRPGDKVNHAIVLGGEPGIGKDSMLEPVKRAVGPWNFLEINPEQLTGRFNGYVKAVVLRISEAADLGDMNRYQFYERMKVYAAAPPDVIRCDEKNLREHPVQNVCGIVITTNHRADALYLPANDRRHYVAWSTLKEGDFSAAYWDTLWRWYDTGGFQNVLAYLQALKLTDFNPKAPPMKTPAFWAIVASGQVPETGEMADALVRLNNPDVVTIAQVITRASEEFGEFLRDRKSSRAIAHRFEECGYVAIRNPDATSGLWSVRGRRQIVYCKATMSYRDQLVAIRKVL